MKGSKQEKRMDLKENMSVKDFVKELNGSGFNGKRLAEAVDIYKAMMNDKNCIKVLGCGGALIAGGLRNVFVKFIKKGFVDVLIPTGAILTHDLIETFGVHHYQGSSITDDVKLAKEETMRIYDVFLPKKGYLKVEEELQKILPLLPQKEMSPCEFLYELGKHIKDENSIIKACYDHNVKIFCPSITDSVLGFQLWMFSQNHALKINPQLDTEDIQNLVWKKDATFGLTILGGGVGKHYLPLMMQVSGKEISYAIQITLDRPEHGGVSGAHLEEAKSWRKLSADALSTTIISDVTIAFPLIVAALI